jgi:hypothetical protein
MAECLTGRVVFPATDLRQVLLGQLSADPVPLDPAVLASSLGAAIRRATQKLPLERYQGAAEMLAAVEQAVGLGTSERIVVTPRDAAGQAASPTAVGTADTVLARDGLGPIVAGTTMVSAGAPPPAPSWPGTAGTPMSAPMPPPAGSWPGAHPGVHPAEASGAWPPAAPTLLGSPRAAAARRAASPRTILAFVLGLVLLAVVAGGGALLVFHGRASDESSAAARRAGGSSDPSSERTERPVRARGSLELPDEAVYVRAAKLGWQRLGDPLHSGQGGTRLAVYDLQKREETARVQILIFEKEVEAQLSALQWRKVGHICVIRGKTVATVQVLPSHRGEQELYDEIFGWGARE